MVQTFGGIYIAANSNLRDPGTLDYILEAIEYSVFDYNLYPTLPEKACALAWQIMKGHVFNDGCKRTAMESARVFLALNGFKLILDPSTPDIAVNATACSVSFQDLLNWLTTRIQ